jgi:hypothetical protein
VDDQTNFNRILQDLIETPPVRFDQQLKAALPKARGLYAISMMGAPKGEYLYVGETAKGANGLRGRVWDQHYQTGGSSSDLIEKVKAKGYARDAGEARRFIEQNCQVQWLELKDDALRAWAEHHLLAALKPRWGS